MRRMTIAILGLLAACDGDPGAPAGPTVTAMGQAEQLAAGDFGLCLQCHGSAMQGNASVGAPALAHLPDWYLRAQLVGFKAGWRGTQPDDHIGQSMQAVTRLMTPAVIDQATAYILSFEVPAAAIPDPESRPANAGAAGAVLYAERCAACHGDAAQGLEEHGAPPLGRFDRRYFTRQLTNYRRGLRGYHDEDAPGAAMAAQAEALSEPDITLLADYLYPGQPAAE